MEPNDVRALISLIDDPDESIFTHVKEKLLSLGTSIIPDLEDSWEHNANSEFQKRVETIIHEIQFNYLEVEIINWANQGGTDLLRGALLVSRIQYPDLDEKKILGTIEEIRKEIWLELNDQLTALEKVKIINHILFDVRGFSGNKDNYHSPQNSYISLVLESKKGNPLSLSILYITLAQELDIPIYGINLPEHFIAAYLDVPSIDKAPFEEIKSKPVLFYINPFSKGIVFGKLEIENFLKQLNVEPKELFFHPCNNIDIVKRILRNLILAFEKEKNQSKKLETEILLEKLVAIKS